jgi:hypothetical protein
MSPLKPKQVCNNIPFQNDDIPLQNVKDDYMKIIIINCEKLIPIYKNQIKINDENTIMPTIQNYNELTKYNYNIAQLKTFAKYYKLKITGNKKQLISRIFCFLYLSSYIIKIQKNFRGMMQRKYNMLHGPASKNRELCTNNTDFITMEPIKEIKNNQFISYKDTDDFIYGFDIVSLYNLVFKNNNDNKNPYNRKDIPDFVLKNIKTLIRLSNILKVPINFEIEDDSMNISSEKAIELKVISLFQNIDSLGNYSNPEWFLSLNKNQIIKFMRELIDIWSYRAQLTIETKRNICPPTGDPFRNFSMVFIHIETNLYSIKKVVIEVLEKLVNLGINRDSKSLGAYYILGALTLVNENAAIAYPWLFQSFGHF